MAQSADLEKTFNAALNYAKNAPGSLNLSNDQQLQMYSLFKQATVGPNTAPAPSRLKMVERAKWDAWTKLGKMSKQDAMKQYIALFTKLAPNWQKTPIQSKL